MVSLAAPLTALDVPEEDRALIARTALKQAEGSPIEVAAALLTALRSKEPTLVRVQKHLLETFSTPATSLALDVASGAAPGVQRAFYEAALAAPDADTPEAMAGVLQAGLGRLPTAGGAPLEAVWKSAAGLLPDFAPKAEALVDLCKQDTLRLRLSHALLGAVDCDPEEVAMLVLEQADQFQSADERHEAQGVHQALALSRTSRQTGIHEQAGRVLIGGTVLRRRV
jgi:hypothetical protein